MCDYGSSTKMDAHSTYSTCQSTIEFVDIFRSTAIFSSTQVMWLIIPLLFQYGKVHESLMVNAPQLLNILVPTTGFEPVPSFDALALNQVCLPFHHAGKLFFLSKPFIKLWIMILTFMKVINFNKSPTPSCLRPMKTIFSTKHTSVPLDILWQNNPHLFMVNYAARTSPNLPILFDSSDGEKGNSLWRRF